MSIDSSIDLLIATALVEEHQVVVAVLDRLANLVHELPDHVLLYEYDTGTSGIWRIAIASAFQMGAVKMGAFAARQFQALRPARAALVGISAAIDTKAVDLGDVPFSSHVLSYDDIAVQEGVLTFRTEGYQADPAMRRAVGALRTSISTYTPWRTECVAIMPAVVAALNELRRFPIIPPAEVRPPHLVVEITAGGPFLLRDADFRDSLRTPTKQPKISRTNKIRTAHPVHPKLLSAEMESHGFMAAALEDGVPACVLKGISDTGDRNKQRLERKSGGFFRAYACSNSVLAILHILRQTASSIRAAGSDMTHDHQAGSDMTHDHQAVDTGKSTAEVERLLSEAWDLMGGEAGTETVVAGRARPKDLELARRLIEDQALNLNPKHPKGHLYLGVYYLLTGRNSKAIETIGTAVELDPRSPRAHTALGFALMASDPVSALREYDIAIALDPHYATAHRNRASALSALGNPDAALAALERGVDAAPRSAELANELAVWLAERSALPAAALKYAERAASLEPNVALYQSNLSRNLRMLNRHREADEAAVKAIGLDPNCTHALIEMGAALLHKGNAEGAIEQYEKAIRLNPDAFSPYLNLAAIYYKLRDETSVVEVFRRALRRDSLRAAMPDYVSRTFIGAATESALRLLAVANQTEQQSMTAQAALL